MNLIYQVLAIITILCLDLWLTGARVAFQHVSQARLLSLRETREKPANRALALLPFLPRLHSSFNLALVFSRLILAALLISIQIVFFSYWAWTGWLILFTMGLALFWIEQAVERSAMRAPEVWAARSAFWAKVLLMFFAWGTWLPQGKDKDGKNSLEPISSAVTEDDLMTLVDTGQEEGLFEQDERRMIYSIFRLGETLAREIMVPRIDMVTLDVVTPLQKAVQVMLDSGHSRVPVYEETVDQMLGVLYGRDLLRKYWEANDLASVRDLIRTPYLVPEAKHVDVLLEEMQTQRIHLAIVVDEYGGVAGMITLEDIVEEIIGEIQDEYDQGEESPYQALEGGEFLFLGKVDLEKFNEVMESNLPKDEADTLGGFIYGRLGRVPAVGETVQQDGLRLTVEQVTARRIRKVRAKKVTNTGADYCSSDGTRPAQHGNIEDDGARVLVGL